MTPHFPKSRSEDSMTHNHEPARRVLVPDLPDPEIPGPTIWVAREVRPDDDHDEPGAAALMVVAALVLLVAAVALAAWVTFR